MPRFAHAIVVVIEADTYEESLGIADDIAEGLTDEDATLASYEHDNENQRLVYLGDYNAMEEAEDA